jgi:hypothetical protein
MVDDDKVLISHSKAVFDILQDAPACRLPAEQDTISLDALRIMKRAPFAQPLASPNCWSLNVKAPYTNSIPIARMMVDFGGSAKVEDQEAVTQHLAVFPPKVLELAHTRSKIGVIACRNSVTDVRPDWSGQRPRGWRDGTWDIVPGTVDTKTKTVIVATKGIEDGGRTPVPYGDRHSSFNLVAHEFMHAFNYYGRYENGFGSEAKRFADARNEVLSRIDRLDLTNDQIRRLEYYRQQGFGGNDETYAESGCRWFYGDPLLRESETFAPLANYWKTIERELGIKDERR